MRCRLNPNQQMTQFSLPFSVNNKALPVSGLVISHRIDIPALTKTWPHIRGNAQVLSELIFLGYDILQVAQPDKRGGSSV